MPDEAQEGPAPAGGRRRPRGRHPRRRLSRGVPGPGRPGPPPSSASSAPPLHHRGATAVLPIRCPGTVPWPRACQGAVCLRVGWWWGWPGTSAPSPADGTYPWSDPCLHNPNRPFHTGALSAHFIHAILPSCASVPKITVKPPVVNSIVLLSIRPPGGEILPVTLYIASALLSVV